MSVPPAAMAVATPAGLTVATLVADELQLTVLPVLPSENVTVAVNACVKPVGTAALCGETTTLTGTGAVTLSVTAVDVTAPRLACMLNGP